MNVSFCSSGRFSHADKSVSITFHLERRGKSRGAPFCSKCFSVFIILCFIQIYTLYDNFLSERINRRFG